MNSVNYGSSYYKYGNVQCLVNTAITERRFDLHNEEEGTENKAMETRHRSHTATLLA